eukprot:COSAG03_NODE_148_length_11571_cov_9.471583_3_plen_492_part_00
MKALSASAQLRGEELDKDGIYIEYGSMHWRRLSEPTDQGRKGFGYYGDASRLVLWIQKPRQLRLVSDMTLHGIDVSRSGKPAVKLVPPDGTTLHRQHTLPATKGRFTVLFKGGWSYVSANVNCSPETYRTFIFQRMFEILGKEAAFRYGRPAWEVVDISVVNRTQSQADSQVLVSVVTDAAHMISPEQWFRAGMENTEWCHQLDDKKDSRRHSNHSDIRLRGFQYGHCYVPVMLNADPIRTRVGFRADVTPRLEMQRSETKTYGTDCNAMYDQRPYFDFEPRDERRITDMTWAPRGKRLGPVVHKRLDFFLLNVAARALTSANPRDSLRTTPPWFSATLSLLRRQVYTLVPKITAHTMAASAVGAFLTFGPDAKPDPATLAIRGAALDAVRTWRSKMVAAWHRSMANGGPPPAAPNAAQLRDCFRARLVRCIEVDHCSTLDTSTCTTGGDGLRARARKQRTHTKHEFDDRWGPLAQWHQDSGPSLHWDTVT